MNAIRSVILSATCVAVVGCASVDVTKTGKGYYPRTNPNEVEILMTVPQRPYMELGSVTATNFRIREEAKLHNAVRAKSAPLGADAVIIQSQGIVPTGFGDGYRWATGVAIRYK